MLKIPEGKDLSWPWKSGCGEEGLMVGRGPFCIYNALDKSIVFQTLLFNWHMWFHRMSLVFSFLLGQFKILIHIQQ